MIRTDKDLVLIRILAYEKLSQNIQRKLKWNKKTKQ